MRSKFVVRLLDAVDNLMAWASVEAEAKPQRTAASCPFWPIAPTQFVIEQTGEVVKMSIHWADLDVARVQNITEPTRVEVGQVFNFSWIEPVWLVPGMRDVPLPAVTVRGPVNLSPPVGTLMAVGTR